MFKIGPNKPIILIYNNDPRVGGNLGLRSVKMAVSSKKDKKKDWTF